MMRLTMNGGLLSILALAALPACIAPPIGTRPALPAQLAGHGLLVAEIRREQPLHDDTAVVIGGRPVGRVHRGYLALPLAPGDYTLDAVVDVPRGVGARVDRTVAVDRAFEIHAGKVTSLGLLMWLGGRPNTPDSELAALDNSSAMRDYLALHYPSLYAGLGPDAVEAAFGPYASPTALDALRREIARSTLSLWAGIDAGFDAPAIAVGPAGTIARVTRDAHGTVTSALPFDTGTLANVAGASRAGDRYGFLTADNRLFLLERGELRALAIPASLRAVTVQLFGAHGIALVDGRLVIHASSDDGETWRPHAQFALDLPADADAVGVHGGMGPDAVYLYTVRNDGGRPRVLASPLDTVAFSAVPIPGEVKSISQLVARRVGLFLNPGAGHARRAFHFRPAGGAIWEKRVFPSEGSGCRLEFPDADGQTVIAVCPARYRSTDGGRGWAREL
ncbi:MAG TPA: hypothetical protein VGA00_14445 [Acidiferrobacterales bacterium]